MKSKKEVLEIIDNNIIKGDNANLTTNISIYYLKAIAEALRYQVERGL